MESSWRQPAFGRGARLLSSFPCKVVDFVRVDVEDDLAAAGIGIPHRDGRRAAIFDERALGWRRPGD